MKLNISQEEILKEYNEFSDKLDYLINIGLGDSEVADEVRDNMDPLWYSMDEETLEKIK